jgi:uncharacterized protein (TIGR00730 family)
MSQMIKTVTIYGASSSKVNGKYIEAAFELGKLLAARNITCINGGGNNGLMAAVTDAIVQSGGKVIGIIPRFMVDEGWAHGTLTELIITKDMHTRKQMMAQKSDACIALPGGIGTMEELLEIMTWKQLGLYNKPLAILNISGYYDDLLNMLERSQRESFMHHSHSEIGSVVDTPENAIKVIFEEEQWHTNPRSVAAL